MTQIGAGTALRQPPVRITTVINNHMHDSGPVHSSVIITIVLYGARIAHLFIRVCALITMASYHRPSLTTSATNIFLHLCLDAGATKQKRRCTTQIVRAACHATERAH